MLMSLISWKMINGLMEFYLKVTVHPITEWDALKKLRLIELMEMVTG